MKCAAILLILATLTACGSGAGGGTQTSPTQTTSTENKPLEPVIKRPTAATMPRNPNEVPAVFPVREPDPAKASITADPAIPAITDDIMKNRATPRKSPVPFTKSTIPDPDDRANMPSVPVTPESMPAIPFAK